MTGLKIDTEERLKGVIDLIFEKVIPYMIILHRFLID